MMFNLIEASYFSLKQLLRWPAVEKQSQVKRDLWQLVKLNYVCIHCFQIEDLNYLKYLWYSAFCKESGSGRYTLIEQSNILLKKQSSLLRLL